MIMNRKTHAVAGVLLGTAVYIVTGSVLYGACGFFGSLFNDFDYQGIPFFGRSFHRKLLHNIWIIIGLYAASWMYPQLKFVAGGMLMHNWMDVWSRGPVYILWPIIRDDRGELGGWGVTNDSVLSPVVGMGAAVLFGGVYLKINGGFEVLWWWLYQLRWIVLGIFKWV